MSNRFYTSFSLALGPCILQGPEAHHLATVCRFRPGDTVILFNGDGSEYVANVCETDRKRVSLEITEVAKPERELGFRLEVAVTVPKGDRCDFLIEKLTELGATDVVPLRTEHSVVHPRDTKLERLNRTVIEASKQCGRNVLMRIHAAASWDGYVRRDGQFARRLICVPGASGRPSAEMADTCVAIGPEGGFTAEELAQAAANGWQSVSLGTRILRTETAAIAIVAKLAG